MNLTNAMRTLEDTLVLPYTLEIVADQEEGGWLVKVRALRGWLTQADHWEDIPALIEDAMRAWLAAALEFGNTIPLPNRLATS